MAALNILKNYFSEFYWHYLPALRLLVLLFHKASSTHATRANTNKGGILLALSARTALVGVASALSAPYTRNKGGTPTEVQNRQVLEHNFNSFISNAGHRTEFYFCIRDAVPKIQNNRLLFCPNRIIYRY